jgi:cation/acetate symporter
MSYQTMAFQSNSRPANPNIGTSYATFASIIIGLVVILVIFEQLGINNLWLGHVVLAVPVFAYLVIGFLMRTILVDEFYVSGRRVPAFYNGLAYAGASFGGIGFFAVTGSLFIIGFDALAIGLGLAAGLVLMSVLFVPYIRKYGAYTLAAFLGERFNSKVIRLSAAVFLLVPSMMLLSAEIRIAAEVISQFTSTDFKMLIFISAAIVVLSNILGGMRSLTWTTGAQIIVLFMGLLTSLVILSVTHTTLPLPQLTYGSLFADIAKTELAGGITDASPGSLVAALPGENTLVLKKPMQQMFGAIKKSDFLFLLVSVMLGASILPASIMRIGTATSVTQARRSIGWGVVLIGLLLMSVPAVAVFAKYILYEAVIGQPFNALPHWLIELKEAGMVDILDINKDGLLGINELAVMRDSVSLILPIAGELPFVLVGFMAAAGMAAALSAAGAQMVTMSCSISEDLFHGGIWMKASKAKRLLLARLSMIGVMMIAGLIAIRQDFDILHMGLWAFSIAASSFFAPTVLTIWWKGVSGFAIWMGMISGFVVSMSMILLHWSDVMTKLLGIESLTSAIVGVPVSFAAIVAVTYLRPELSDVSSELSDEIRIPDGETIHEYRERIMTGRGL